METDKITRAERKLAGLCPRCGRDIIGKIPMASITMLYADVCKPCKSYVAVKIT